MATAVQSMKTEEGGRGCRRKRAAKAYEAEGSSDDSSDGAKAPTPKLSASSKCKLHVAALALMDLPSSGGSRSPSVESPRPAVAVKKEGATMPGRLDWATKIVRFVHANGPDLLAQVCGRYKLTYDGVLGSIPASMHEQVAHCLLFNPALCKNAEGLPVSIRDCKGVSDFRMQFVQDGDAVVRNIRLSCFLSGEAFSVEMRACSNCGSCFSGRFMDAGAHQRAGGWKEITERISAGKHSWKDLKGWRLCVPCFVNWGTKGSTENSKRASIPQVMDLGLKSISMVCFDGTTEQSATPTTKKRKLASPRPSGGVSPKTAVSAGIVSPPPAKKAKECAPAKPFDATGANGSNRGHTPPAAGGTPPVEGLAGMTGLAYAAATGNEQDVRDLLWSGHDALAVDKTGQSALHIAAGAGHEGVVRALADHGGAPLLMLKDKAGKTCLHRAADAGHLSVCRALCDKGGRGLLLAQAKIGQTCLHNAAAAGHYEVSRLLIERGGRELLMRRDEIGSTCLHWSVEGNQVDTSTLCGEEGGLELMVIQDVVGKTCLHRAVDEGCKEVAEALLDLGGKELLLVQDQDNLTCAQWAVELGSVEVAQVLVEKGLGMMKGLRAEQDAREREEAHRRREADLARREVEVARQERLLIAMKGVSNGGGVCKECGCKRSAQEASGGSSDTGDSSCGKPMPAQTSPEKDECA